MSALTNNLDDTIAAAVKAQIQAQVLEALSGEEFFSKYIASVLNQTVEVSEDGSSYGRKIKTTFLDNALTGTIKKATQKAVEMAIEEERERIQDEVRKAVKRSADQFAANITDAALEAAKSQYNYKFEIGISVPKKEY